MRSVGEEWPADAIQRLEAMVPGLDIERFAADHAHSSENKLVFVLANSDVCPDCGGSGESVGLNVTELNVTETCGCQFFFFLPLPVHNRKSATPEPTARMNE